MIGLFRRYYIKSSKDNAGIPLYVENFDVTYDNVEWTTRIEDAYNTTCQDHVKRIFIRLRENEFSVTLVRRWWWFGWHEEVVLG